MSQSVRVRWALRNYCISSLLNKLGTLSQFRQRTPSSQVLHRAQKWGPTTRVLYPSYPSLCPSLFISQIFATITKDQCCTAYIHRLSKSYHGPQLGLLHLLPACLASTNASPSIFTCRCIWYQLIQNAVITTRSSK